MPFLTRVFAGRAARGLVVFMSVAMLALVARATIGVAYQMQLGNPSSATTDPNNQNNYLVQRDQYALGYNNVTRTPNWVSWDLTADDVGGSGRSPFVVDTTLPATFHQVQTWDYSGSGYDRGHMCPSADRTVTTADNQVTFYMSNMVPQSPDNNQGVWANFESYCRSLAFAGNEVLIVCGPGGFNGSTIASGVSIPAFTWKIVVVVPLGAGMATDRITSSTRVIAIKVPNSPGVRSTPWQSFVTSVAQIEADTGYQFFTTLPAAVADALRVQVDGQTAVGAPAIVVQPAAQTTVVGGSATFAVQASGDAPLLYQWLKDDELIPGATNASYTIASVTAADVGQYDVVISNSVGSITSSPASLIVLGLPPSIVTGPQAQTVPAGSTVSLAVTASGSPTLTYQWRKNFATLTGATNATLTLPNVQAGDIGSYDVVVTNSVSSATSPAASLDVLPAKPTITVQPQPQSTTVGGTATFRVSATGTAPLTYQWRKDLVPLLDGPSTSGVNSPILTLNNVAGGDGGSYDVIVGNTVDSVTSTSATLTVGAPAPSVVTWNFGVAGAATAEPTGGLDAGLSGGTLSQGNNNGTTALLTTTSASGSYSGASGGVNAGAAARIGALNSATSAYFEFTLSPAAGRRLNATAISFGMRSTSTGPRAFTVFTSVDGFTAPVATGAVSSDSTWRKITPAFTPVTGATGAPVTFRIFGHDGTGSPSAGTANWRIDDLQLTVAAVFPPPTAPAVVSTTPAEGAVDIDPATPITITFNEAVSFTGSWFTITSAGQGPISAAVSGGPVTYTLTPPSGFAYNDVITLTILGNNIIDQATGTLAGTTDTTVSFSTGAYVPPTPPTVTLSPISQSVTAGSTVTFTVAATGTAPLTYQWRKNGAPINGNATALSETLTLADVTPDDAASYDCIVSNLAGSDLSQSALLAVTIVPPSIVTPPTAQIATAGGAATFTVTAQGTAPLSYQWRREGVPLADGATVSGANSSNLVLTGVTALDSGRYDVVVSNAASSATSAPAILAVVEAPASIVWDFSSASPSSGVPAGVTGGAVTQGNNNGTTALLTTVSVSSGYAGVSGGANAGAAARVGALNQAAGGSTYFEFTFEPEAGRRFVATALSFGMRSTGTGPQAFALFSSVDGFTTPLATGVVPNNSSWRWHSPVFAGVAGSSGAPVTFRLYGYNGAGSPGTNTANWRIDDLTMTAGILALPPTAPTIVTEPTSQSATVGDSVSFAVVANGTAPLRYQWRKAGNEIEGATAAALTLTEISSADAGDYDVLVSNDFGSTPSALATLTVSRATATVSLAGLAATYDGTPHAAAVSTSPAGLPVSITYNGSAAAPTAAGSYAVLATVEHADYVGAATGTLVIAKAPATITIADLTQAYDGLPKPVTVTTTPAGLNVQLAYSGTPDAPTNPGAYPVVATIVDANHEGTTSGTLTVTITALVRHAPTLNGGIDGSIQVLLGENVTLNGNAWISGDLLVPGTPTLRLYGSPMIGGVLDGIGDAAPSSYNVTLNGKAVVQYLVRRTNPIPMPVVAAPAATSGTRHVIVNTPGESLGDASTIAHLTLQGGAGEVALPPGAYGNVTANARTTLVLGTAGGTVPAVYHFDRLMLNSAALRVVGPVQVVLRQAYTANGELGDVQHPEWLTISVSGGGMTLNGLAKYFGGIVAPAGTVTLNGGSILEGAVIADRLVINGNAVLRQP